MRRFYFNRPDELLQHILSRGVQQDNCLIWTGVKLKGGYGNQRVEGRWIQVHRLRWWLEHGRGLPIEHVLPSFLLICHTCDNPSCFEVSHLFIGTPGMNTRDSHKKGRSKGNPHHSPDGRFTGGV